MSYAEPPPCRIVEKSADGWTIYEHRGVRIRSLSVFNILLMEGHPYFQRNFGQLDRCIELIDWWIDKQAVPPPFVWPAPERPKRG